MWTALGGGRWWGRWILSFSPALQVDGQAVSLPVRLGPVAHVWREQGLVLLQVGTQLQVQFNGHNTLLVRVGPEFRGHLCGLCGNFSGNPSADKVLPSRVPALSVPSLVDPGQLAWVSGCLGPGRARVGRNPGLGESSGQTGSLRGKTGGRRGCELHTRLSVESGTMIIPIHGWGRLRHGREKHLSKFPQ